jgi:hypothetical protein
MPPRAEDSIVEIVVVTLLTAIVCAVLAAPISAGLVKVWEWLA